MAPTAAAVPTPESLSLPEMLRVMDMARALRDERSVVERELNAEETRRLLREQLLESARLTGETVTSAEVDAAIEQYFNSLHTYRDPPFSFSLLLAHLYVRRWLLLWCGLGAAFVSTAAWRTVPSMTPAARQQRVQTQAIDTVEKLLIKAEAEAVDPSAREQLSQIRREVEAASKTGDVAQLHDLEVRLTTLRRRLAEEYEVRIVADRSRKSGIDIYYDDPNIPGVQREPSWFAIVEAWSPQGQRLTRRIKNDKDGQTYDVTTWGERVPREVYERLKADKKDGVLNETLFAVKRRGHLDEEPRLPGVDGKPLSSTGRITRW